MGIEAAGIGQHPDGCFVDGLGLQSQRGFFRPKPVRYAPMPRIASIAGRYFRTVFCKRSAPSINSASDNSAAVAVVRFTKLVMPQP